jgi:hypothetical protein
MASAVAVAGGQVVALVAPPRGRARPRLVRWDPAPGAQRERRLSRDTSEIAAAGGFVATVAQRGDADRTRITVRDARTWKVRTRVVVPADTIETEVALRPDGTLAAVYGSPRLRLGIAKPGDRSMRRIRGVRPSHWTMAFAGNGIVVARRTRRGARLVRVVPGRRPEVLTPSYPSLHAFAAGDGVLAWVTRRTVYAATLERR